MNQSFSSVKEALRYSLLSRAMCSSDIPLGHSASQAPVLVQLPKPSSSILATMFSALRLASGLPCGSSASCDTLAATNSMAEEFLQAATQAPQPMQTPASKALSDLFF